MASKKTIQLTQLSILAALIVVLQLMSYLLARLGVFPLSLVLIPLVIGGNLFGPRAGAGLGLVFGAIVVAACALGWDGSYLWIMEPGFTALVCLTKGVMAGWLGALVARLFQKMNKPGTAVLVSAVVTPIVNTGIFTAGVWFLLREPLTKMAIEFGAGETTIEYLFLTLVGVNFVVEFVVNVALVPATKRIIVAVQRGMR